MASPEGYLASVEMWPIRYAPTGWMLCNGQTLAVGPYQALYALIGNRFGGTPGSNFNLPNLAGRTPIGAGTADDGTAFSLGQNYESSYAGQLALNNMPAHSHQVVGNITATSWPVNKSQGGTPSPANMYLGADGSGIAQVYASTSDGTTMQPPKITYNTSGITVGQFGTGLPFNVIPSFVAINFIIMCTGGIWPPNPN